MQTKLLITLAFAGIMAASLTTTQAADPPKMKMITQQPEMKMTIPIPENIEVVPFSWTGFSES